MEGRRRSSVSAVSGFRYVRDRRRQQQTRRKRIGEFPDQCFGFARVSENRRPQEICGSAIGVSSPSQSIQASPGSGWKNRWGGREFRKRRLVFIRALAFTRVLASEGSGRGFCFASVRSTGLCAREIRAFPTGRELCSRTSTQAADPAAYGGSGGDSGARIRFGERCGDGDGRRNSGTICSSSREAWNRTSVSRAGARDYSQPAGSRRPSRFAHGLWQVGLLPDPLDDHAQACRGGFSVVGPA